MTNAEIDPAEYECAFVECAERIDIITEREVPLGGVRGMPVRRTLPQKKRSLIGPWCFIDHFGPDDVSVTGGMTMPRHPHTGLATVTLLHAGSIDHIDSTGFGNTIRPGEVNLMIAGNGVTHSEFSEPDIGVLHGVQLWYALPDSRRFDSPQSQHHAPDWVPMPGGRVLTYLGELAGTASPIDTWTPALAGEVVVAPGATVTLALNPSFEHGVLATDGPLELGAAGARQSVILEELAYVPAGAPTLSITAPAGSQTRATIIGGPPFTERIVMWWNFVARDHDEVVAFREQYQAEMGFGPGAPTAPLRFGHFPPDTPAPLPAPDLPNARITPRRNPS